jgi:hypothetical protein
VIRNILAVRRVPVAVVNVVHPDNVAEAPVVPKGSCAAMEPVTILILNVVASNVAAQRFVEVFIVFQRVVHLAPGHVLLAKTKKIWAASWTSCACSVAVRDRDRA